MTTVIQLADRMIMLHSFAGNMSSETPYSENFEEKIRTRIEESGHECKKKRLTGKSGNSWELDGVVRDSDENIIGILEVKSHDPSTTKDAYRDHMKRAAAELADFRDMDVPVALVISDKRDFGNRDWDRYFESIGAMLIDEDGLSRFLERIEQN